MQVDKLLNRRSYGLFGGTHESVVFAQAIAVVIQFQLRLYQYELFLYNSLAL